MENEQELKKYAKMLMERIIYYFDSEKEAEKRFKELEKEYKNSNKDYYDFYNTLNKKDKKVICNNGRFYNKSDFKRLRIELSKILIEIEN